MSMSNYETNVYNIVKNTYDMYVLNYYLERTENAIVQEYILNKISFILDKQNKKL